MTISEARHLFFVAKFLDDNPGLLRLPDLAADLAEHGQALIPVIRDDEALLGWQEWDYADARYYRWSACPPEYRALPPPFAVVRRGRLTLALAARLDGSSLKGICREARLSDIYLMSYK